MPASTVDRVSVALSTTTVRINSSRAVGAMSGFTGPLCLFWWQLAGAFRQRPICRSALSSAPLPRAIHAHDVPLDASEQPLAFFWCRRRNRLKLVGAQANIGIHTVGVDVIVHEGFR